MSLHQFGDLRLQCNPTFFQLGHPPFENRLRRQCVPPWDTVLNQGDVVKRHWPREFQAQLASVLDLRQCAGRD